MKKSLRVLVTACGCPGATTLIRMLQKAALYDNRKVTIIGIDCDSEAIGRLICDGFYQVPKVKQEDEYLDALLSIILAENIDVVFPESSLEVPILACHKKEIEATGCVVVVSSYESIVIAQNKWLLFREAEKVGCALPEWKYPRTLDGFIDAVKELGYPKKAVCFKPHIGKGSRGFRVIDHKADRYKQLMKYKPNSKYITLETFIEIFEDKNLPDLLVMEYLRGMEYTSDCLCLDGEPLITQVKSNEQARWGVTVRGELVDKPEIRKEVEKVLSIVPLSYNVNLQYIDGKLIEINPRVSTFIYQDDLIPPYLAIQLALKEKSAADIRKYQAKIAYGRRFIRYMDQMFI